MVIYHTIRSKEGVSSPSLARLTRWGVDHPQPVTLFVKNKRADAKSFREIMNLSFRKGEQVSLQISDATGEAAIASLTSILNTYF